MISKSSLKEIILLNRAFILDSVPDIVPRQAAEVTASGKTEYAQWGGFPEATIASNPLDKAKLLKEYLRAMFFRDLVERYGMTNIALFDALSDKLFSSFSTRMSLTAFYRQDKDLFSFSKDLLFNISGISRIAC